MKKVILIILILLLLPNIKGEMYREVLEMESYCVHEDITLKIRGESGLELDEYRFINCSKYRDEEAWDWWKCKCNSQNTLIFDFNYTYNNTYDVVAQYYIEPLEEVTDKEPGQIRPSEIELRNNGRKRTNYFNNIKYLPPEEPPPEEKKFTLPEINFSSILLIAAGIIGVAIVVTFIIVQMIKREWKTDEVKLTTKKRKRGEPPPGFKPLKEGEADDYVDRYL